MSPESQAFVVFSVGMLLLMGLGMNMGLALVLTGAGMAWVLNFWDTQLLAQNLVAGVDSFALLAVPFFILAGELMNAGGISRRVAVGESERLRAQSPGWYSSDQLEMESNHPRRFSDVRAMLARR